MKPEMCSFLHQNKMCTLTGIWPNFGFYSKYGKLNFLNSRLKLNSQHLQRFYYLWKVPPKMSNFRKCIFYMGSNENLSIHGKKFDTTLHFPWKVLQRCARRYHAGHLDHRGLGYHGTVWIKGRHFFFEFKKCIGGSCLPKKRLFSNAGELMFITTC